MDCLRAGQAVNDAVARREVMLNPSFREVGATDTADFGVRR
jgi:hypothetical protein